MFGSETLHTGCNTNGGTGKRIHEKVLTGHSKGFGSPPPPLQSTDREKEFLLLIEKLKLYQGRFWIDFRLSRDSLKHFSA